VPRKARYRVLVVDHAYRHAKPAQAADDPKTLVIAADHNRSDDVACDGIGFAVHALPTPRARRRQP
jgi:hypothetical protein